MPLVEAKCTNCGAVLKVDSGKEAAICEFCGSAYIVEKAIHNHITTNNNEIHADTVNIYGTAISDFVIRGDVLIKYNGLKADIVIPNSVKIIGVRAFENCDGLRSVEIPPQVTEIGFRAFCGCADLGTVKFSYGLRKIGDRAFERCHSLTSVRLPDSVTSIGSHAFLGCCALQSVRIPNKVSYFGSEAFYLCERLLDVQMPKHLLEVARERECFSGTRWEKREREERQKKLAQEEQEERKKRKKEVAIALILIALGYFILHLLVR